MDIIAILQSKPVLIGLHLGFAILGIDAFLWLLWKFRSKDSFQKSGFKTALAGVVFLFSVGLPVVIIMLFSMGRL